MGARKGYKDPEKDKNDGAIAVDKDTRENDEDKEKEKEEEKGKENRVSFTKLFKYADRLDVLLMVAGTVGAVGLGVAMPLLSLLFGQLTNAFGQNISDVNMLVEEVSEVALRFLWVALGAATAAYMEMACWMLTGERQSARIRSLYLRAILRQEIGFFDKGTSTGEVVGHMSGDIVTLQEAIGEKVGQYLRFMATFIAGFAVAFASGWKLTLVMLSVLPLLAICGSIMAVVIKRATTKGQEAYAEAGTVVEECIGAIRTVLAFAGEAKAVGKYNKNLDRAFHAGVKQGLATGLGIGTTMLVMFSSYALALWYGSTLVATPGSGYTGGTVMTVLFGVIIGGMSLGQAAPNLASFASGQAAAFKIFQTIDRAPIIDSADPSGETPDSVEGEVELHDVTFSYPARPDVTIFSGFSLRIPAGRSMALVGESGSGKSTVVALLERFYDPLSGEVRLDGRDIRTLQLRWLRAQLALVSQEPVLFDTSIATNISYGKEGATQEEIAAAARMANIHSFIESLPEGYATQVGERGIQLSGGQKQRIAIARAVLRNPRVLLLDEATSALDAESEKVVQRALDSLMGGRTTIIVAHRLSTVRNADCIAVLQRGKIVETGTHADLISRPDGAYFQLVRLQNMEANGHGQHSGAPTHRHSDSDSSVQSLANGTSDGTSPPVAEDGLAGASGKHRHVGGAAGGAGAGAAAAEDSALLSGSAGEAKAAASGSSGGAPGGARAAAGEETQKKKSGFLGLFRRKGKVQGDVELGEGKVDKKEEKKPKDESFGRLLLLNKPEWPVAFLGLLAACGNGLMFPIFSILLSNIITTLYNPDPDVLRQDANFWSLMFVVLAASVMVLLTSQMFLFALVGSYLVRRVRRMCFTAVLRQEVAWFDQPENSSGAIGARLSTDAAQVRAMVGDRLSLIVQNTATIVAGLVIAFKACWQLSLVVLCVVPLLIIAGGMQISAIKGFSENAKVMFEDASRVANDAVGSIRTVAAFGAEERVLALYDEKCDMPIRSGIRKANVSGLGLAFANFVMFAAYSLSFWVGGQLVKNGATTFQNVFQVFFAIVMSAMGVAQSAGLAPDVATVQTAVNSIFRILDRQSAIDPSAPGKTVEGEGGVRGEVELRDVCFHYPSRPDVTIFDHLNLTVPAGKTVALVGESGSGKSTVIALVERFYDPLSGMVLLDGCDIRTLQLQWLRRQMALVSQEPTLFNVSIRENIAYGREGDTSEAEIVEAAKAANAHSFISALPDGYDTLVGERGVQLSGGQKQRVAIARAVLMDPRVLLLDEATSALDAESEKVVQDALERVMVGRTTIVIAHRLATIVNADKIAVFQKGRVVEEGTHDELVARGGAYASLAALQ